MTHGILQVLRTNRAFRALWAGQLISQIGDWFNNLAVMTLLVDFDQSATLIASALILRMLPSLVLAPVAGVVVDRWVRKRIMIFTDLARAVVVLGFLLIHGQHQSWLVFALILAQVSLGAFFQPALSAAVPSVVAPGQLLAANALTSLTWSLSLALGSWLGGITIDAFGRDAAFAIDAASFLVSAACIAMVDVPRRAARGGRLLRDALEEMRAGFRYLTRHAGVRSLVLVKSGVGCAGGLTALLPILGEKVYRHGRTAAFAIGALYAARGVGTALGPFLGRVLTGDRPGAMRGLIGGGFLLGALFFAVFGAVDDLWIASIVLACAHMGTSINWVFSTVLLQIEVEDDFRGRVFAAEMALFTITFCAAAGAVGIAIDHLHVDPQHLASACGLVLLLPAALWIRSRRGTPDA